MVDPINPSMQDPKKVTPHHPPKSPQHPPTSPSDSEAAQDSSKTVASWDPAGVWQKFLSGKGSQAVTEDDIKKFIMGIENMFKSVIQQSDKAAKRAAEQLRKSFTGEE